LFDEDNNVPGPSMEWGNVEKSGVKGEGKGNEYEDKGDEKDGDEEEKGDNQNANVVRAEEVSGRGK
jgi:hypothetical protein